MPSDTPKAKPPTRTETKTVSIPSIPQDIIDEILDYFAIDSDHLNVSTRASVLGSLRSCALVSKSWAQSCRRHLFRTVVFDSRAVNRWLKVFPVAEESPTHCVRNLTIWIASNDHVPEAFFECTPWFTNVEEISLRGYGGGPPLRRPSLWRLPQSITTLDLNSSEVTPVQLRDIMAQLPNLDNLSLVGSFVAVDRRELLGIGTVLRGRFGGQLIFSSGRNGEDVINMLLEIPSGLRFTEVQVYGSSGGHPSAVRLAEACSKTVVKLLHHETFSHGKSHHCF